LLQQRWAPGPRLLAGAAGGGLICLGVARRNLSGLLAGLAGAVVLVRAATNLRLARLTGVGACRRAVEVQKHLVLDAAALRRMRPPWCPAAGRVDRWADTHRR
jgi:uncharacterized membrane protein